MVSQSRKREENQEPVINPCRTWSKKNKPTISLTINELLNDDDPFILYIFLIQIFENKI